jgi:hypothetical protein
VDLVVAEQLILDGINSILDGVTTHAPSYPWVVAPAYEGKYYTPTLRLAMWHALAGTRGLRHPSVRPYHLASPSRRREREKEREREREKVGGERQITRNDTPL